MLLFVALVIVVFLNQVGLPDFIKATIVAQLEAQGWELQFSRMRLRWYRGIVVEHLQLQRSRGSAGPRVFADEAECQLNHGALQRLELEINRVQLRGGRLLWPLQSTNQPRRTLCVSEVNADVRFSPDDRWHLTSLTGEILRVKVDLSATITNGSAIRTWKFARRPGQPRVPFDERAHRWLTLASPIQWPDGAALRGYCQGDARHPSALQSRLVWLSPTVSSPWLRATNVFLDTRSVTSVESNDPPTIEIEFGTEMVEAPWGRAEKLRARSQLGPWTADALPKFVHLSIEANQALTRWGQASESVVAMESVPHPTNAALRRTELNVLTHDLSMRWGKAGAARFESVWEHSATNLSAFTGSARIRCDQPETQWGGADALDLTTHGLSLSTNILSLLDTNRHALARAQCLPLDFGLAVTNFRTPQVQAPALSITGQWHWPNLSVDCKGAVAGGDLDAKAQVNAETGEVSFAGASSCDPRALRGMLKTNTQDWLAKYSWETPPKLVAEGRVTLQVWTNGQPDWRREVLPSLTLQGRFEVGAGAYLGIPFNLARSPFTFSNMIWRLPELRVTRPEGNLEGAYQSDQRTRDFHWHLRSTIDPKIARPLFKTQAAQNAFDFVDFSAPPSVDAEIWGRWGEWDRIGVVGKVAATNFTFRGETVKDCVTRVAYTNRFLVFLDPQVQREGERGTAPGIGIDFAGKRVYLTNVIGNLNPYAVARSITAKTGEAIAPYQFSSAPNMRVHGEVDARRGGTNQNLHFSVEGGPFRWKKFRLPRVNTDVAWIGKSVTLTNARAAFYGGSVEGLLQIDFTPTNGADFSFDATVSDAVLQWLMNDFGTGTNKLEGTFSGILAVSHANTADPNSWQGQGKVVLKDGLIWDIPVFGLFSPLLDAFMPGLGRSRAKEGNATYVITNSVIVTKDLSIRATAMRLQYDVSIDFARRIEGRMEAELLRDVPAVGLVISKLFWPVTKLFEYRISGTLDQPKAEPIFVVPRLLFLPFRPLKTLKELLPEEPSLPAKRNPPPLP